MGHLVPYLMSSHPGCTLKDAVDLAIFLKKHNIRPEQVQDFYPTPGTISTAMFWTGLDPYTMEPIFVPRTPEEKKLQRVLLQYFKKENRDLVEKALTIAGRRDLVGTGANCLIPPAEHPRKPAGGRPAQGNRKPSGKPEHRRNASPKKQSRPPRKKR